MRAPSRCARTPRGSTSCSTMAGPSSWSPRMTCGRRNQGGPSSRWCGTSSTGSVICTTGSQRTVLNKKGASPTAGQTHTKYAETALFRHSQECATVRICAQSSHLLIENHSLRRRPSASSRNVRPRASERSAPSSFRTAGRPDSPTSRKSGSSGSWASRGTS